MVIVSDYLSRSAIDIRRSESQVVTTDDDGETTVDGVYAAGRVTETYQAVEKSVRVDSCIEVNRLGAEAAVLRTVSCFGVHDATGIDCSVPEVFSHRCCRRPIQCVDHEIHR